MNCGFKVIYAYTESDEISLLFDLDIDLFRRKVRKYNSILAGEASAQFSLLLGDTGVFVCRICQLPTEQIVVDYFRWRSEDAHRNALNAHCYWMLRKKDYDKKDATAFIEGKTTAEKNELLFSGGINFNDLPNWQKRGVGLYWTKKTSEREAAALHVDYDLPMREEYSDFIHTIILP
jgi:tRNA(His) 5'-end guanylyltransferase